MKKYINIIILLLLISITSCKANKPKLNLDDLYGKLYYDECIYLSPYISDITIAEETANHKGISRFDITENSFYYYETSSPEASMTLRMVTYQEKDVNDNLTINNDVKDILKNMTTRYDIYRNNTFQCYSFLYDGKDIYYMETRRLVDNTNYDIWKIVRLK